MLSHTNCNAGQERGSGPSDVRQIIMIRSLQSCQSQHRHSKGEHFLSFCQTPAQQYAHVNITNARPLLYVCRQGEISEEPPMELLEELTLNGTNDLRRKGSPSALPKKKSTHRTLPIGECITRTRNVKSLVETCLAYLADHSNAIIDIRGRSSAGEIAKGAHLIYQERQSSSPSSHHAQD